MSRRLLVVGAHSADFVWRAGGTIAATTQGGGAARVVALSYGERGESGEMWKVEGQTVENVRRTRHAEAERAAAALGAEFQCLDFGDYPLEVGPERLAIVADAMREFGPTLVLTHTDTDPFNPDHAVTHTVVVQARGLAAGAGVSSAFPTITPPELMLFEPHQPELCNFTPTVFVDITPVLDAKQEAMAAIASQTYLQGYYQNQAEQRGNHARRISGDQSVRCAEAFQRVLPQVVKAL